MISVGLKSLAVRFPREIRTNAYFRDRHPALVADAEARTLAKLWRPEGGTRLLFDRCAAPYLSDPFRGAVERRVCAQEPRPAPGAESDQRAAPGHPRGAEGQPDSEDAFTLELGAAVEALERASLLASEVDLLIACSFRASHIGVGNAAFIARALGLRGTAWNLETACSSAVTALQVAVGLVRAGLYRNVLVTVSCTYSLDTDEADTLSWFMGDGAGAFLVGSVPPGQGYLGGSFLHTGETCEAFAYEPTLEPATGGVVMRIRSGPGTGRILRETSAPFVERCCWGALQDAGVAIEEIRCFVVNTPTAWFADFAAAVLGIDPGLVVNTNPLYGNIGPALTTANLHYAARTGRLGPGDLALVYAIGSVSSAGAVVLRWGDVALGGDPPRVYDRPLPVPSVRPAP